ncbi:MAG: Phytochrome, two-component sensor histidine kinase [Myxococcaceae bacterium]|nr:Phytochrome, two-component sensor histidine kinase [Myxococcaceae bacterium]
MTKLDLAQAFQLSPNAYMVLDAELRYVAANDMYLRLTGSSRESLLGKRVFDLFPNDPNNPNNASLLLLRGSFERVLESGQTDVLAVLPYRVPMPGEHGPVDEERFWSATHVPLLDEHGQVAFIMQHTVDITELHRLKQAAATHTTMEAGIWQRALLLQGTNQTLQQERGQLLSLFDQAPSFMAFLRGPEHVFDMANVAYERLVGFRKVVGKRVVEALPEVVEQGFVAILDGVYQKGEVFVGRGVQVFLQRSGEGASEERFVDFIYQPIRDSDGSTVGIFVQGHDITEQKQAEAQVRELNEALERRVAERTMELQEANKELESFSYSVSHDLRAPLRHITGFAQLLERRAKKSLDEVSLGHLRTISEAAKEGGRLVDDLLAFSRMGRTEVKKVGVNLLELVQQEQRDLASELGERAITWQVGELPEVSADPALLRLVIKNLLSNAVKYTRPRSAARIEVQAREEDGEVHLWITDNGVGFDMRYVDKLFGVFQRLHTAEQFEGTGIGLANVRRIVNRHGGRVWAEAKLDQGATFHFTLPVANPA